MDAKRGAFALKNYQRDLERFFLRNREKGIPDLMLYIAIGNLIVFVFSLFDPSNLLTVVLEFNREAILSGQVWRLVTFVLVPNVGGGLFGGLLIFLLFFFYFRIGRALEQIMGRLKFDLFYLAGVLFLDVFGLLFSSYVSASDLNFSLLLAFATVYPEGQALLFGIIPLKMKVLAWIYLGITALNFVSGLIVYLTPVSFYAAEMPELAAFRPTLIQCFLPLVPLLNYALFFWRDIPNILPFLRRTSRPKRPHAQKGPHIYQGETKTQKAYRHRCTVCGRTDTDFPDLEFRYCSRCSGYHCYCMDHINNHAHITEE